MSNTIQKVATICRYPVKSMMGEELNASEITPHGVLGDRAYALVDIETGKVVSAKNPRKWPDIFFYHAAYVTPPLGAQLPPIRITLPCGKSLLSDASNADAELSAALKRTVSLCRAAPEKPILEQFWPEFAGQANEISQEAVAGDAPKGTFFDYATIHLLTTASLTKLNGLYPEGRFESRRFRPNIVIDTIDQNGFVENDWVGKTIRIGDSVRLLITDPCPRCIMPTLAQGDLPRDIDVMSKGILQNRVMVPFAGKSLPSIGVYARVIAGGMICHGDSIIIEE
ncbi:MAG: hypothetical protein RLZZ09_2031 [Pseudomonadota bacterium]|jgi:uncharacterized protein YcbX